MFFFFLLHQHTSIKSETEKKQMLKQERKSKQKKISKFKMTKKKCIIRYSKVSEIYKRINIFAPGFL